MVVYTLEQCWEVGLPILAKNYLLRWSSFWSCQLYKQAKLSHLGHIKSACIHWKDDAPKTSHCLVRILVQRHNWGIFLRKRASRGRYSQWRSLSGHVERIFVHKNWRGRYWQHLVSTGWRCVPHKRSYTWCVAPCFWRSHYQPQSWCRLATSELRFDTVGLLFVGCCPRLVLLRRQARDNWLFKVQYSSSRWWNPAAHNR